jgi:L-serine dehydratase
MAFVSVSEMLAAAQKSGLPLPRVIIESDLAESGITADESRKKMDALWQVMQETSKEYDPARRSASGLTGGDAARVTEACAKGQLFGGDYLGAVIAEALKTAECNACMQRIVAAPTAGSCGVLPAVLLPLARMGKADDAACCEALYVAAGFGQVIASRATLAGAEGGCQAEVGAASAMAAAALCYLGAGSPVQCSEAAAMALAGLLGLVCDPVAGLVEVPCVKRNVTGAVNAVAAADMALSGVTFTIPCDEVIDAMGRIGSQLTSDLRETARGGLADTPTGRAIAKKLYGTPEL